MSKEEDVIYACPCCGKPSWNKEVVCNAVKKERERIEKELKEYDKGWKTPHQQFIDLEVVIKIVRGEA